MKMIGMLILLGCSISCIAKPTPEQQQCQSDADCRFLFYEDPCTVTCESVLIAKDAAAEYQNTLAIQTKNTMCFWGALSSIEDCGNLSFFSEGIPAGFAPACVEGQCARSTTLRCNIDVTLDQCFRIAE